MRSPLLNLPRERIPNLAIQYLTDTQGNPNAVITAIAIWKQIFPENLNSVEMLTESIEDYCLNRAMDEALETPLLSQAEALKFLEEDSDKG
ncbi:MAG: hypothetical protein KA717_28415 [Woronichinia naegeliana WA131]|jgi:hypothetical protein|uniref:Uncharacterized protein n=1 Tax=Woronichinia naegeliana WA131 TaxID=2824559 RepID=A0A977PVL1_9CYAN|nr:MAG: hypothetical protein KA717_28415 [Woronichinia naegeliana WA131]